jgi:hypothetical protein
MRAKPIAAVQNRNLVGFALGLAIVALGAALAHAAPPAPQNQPSVAAIPAAPSPAPANFVCHAQPGGWCDLRDWNGFAAAVAQANLKSER